MLTQTVEQLPASEVFEGRQFDQDTLVLCVRWYLGFKLRSCDLLENMSERGIALAHATILRWGQHYMPEFEQFRKRYACPVGGSRRCDETYIELST